MIEEVKVSKKKIEFIEGKHLKKNEAYKMKKYNFYLKNQTINNKKNKEKACL